MCMRETRTFDQYIPKTRPAFWYPPELPDDKETVLIISGDLWSGTKFIEYAGFSWISEVSKQFKHVLIVLGNHDFWPTNDKLTIRTGATKCNNLLVDMRILNVTVLDCDTFSFPEDPDILFVGATMWTDMDRGNPLRMMHMSSYMAYDSQIAVETGDYGIKKLTSERWVAEHKRHRDYIKLISEQNRDKKIFVITHHVPLTTLGDPKYNGDLGNSYYYSDLSYIILDNPHITHWCYGHTHHQRDEMFETCRMLNNAVGYQGEHFEQQGLVKHEVIEI